ncbi:MAG: helix-turn-helix transcriptional regulator [Puniceicoccales bacterium]|jgi:transcriptional regulator with XRE-family HTH domain|nr:helix-turn-helix transcriptional regulator [Puniceicoccales bacterium]
MLFSEKLTLLMKERGLSQYELARQMDVSSGTINGWCRGVNNPQQRMLSRLALFFNLGENVLSDDSADLPLAIGKKSNDPFHEISLKLDKIIYLLESLNFSQKSKPHDAGLISRGAANYALNEDSPTYEDSSNVSSESESEEPPKKQPSTRLPLGELKRARERTEARRKAIAAQRDNQDKKDNKAV